MDKQELIASLLLIGFTDLSGDGGAHEFMEDSGATDTYWDVIEPHGEVYVDFYPEEGRCCVDINGGAFDYDNYQEAWNHIKTLLPEE